MWGDGCWGPGGALIPEYLPLWQEGPSHPEDLRASSHPSFPEGRQGRESQTAATWQPDKRRTKKQAQAKARESGGPRPRSGHEAQGQDPMVVVPPRGSVQRLRRNWAERLTLGTREDTPALRCSLPPELIPTS